MRKKEIHRKINTRHDAAMASRIHERAFLLLDSDGTYCWTLPKNLGLIGGYKKIIAQYKNGIGRNATM